MVSWLAAEHNFLNIQSDVLRIFDCCGAACLTNPNSARATQPYDATKSSKSNKPQKNSQQGRRIRA